MAIEVIDGIVESATVKRSTSALSLYKEVVFRLKDGSERRLETVAAAPDIAATLQPGTDGRFYAYKAVDHRGLLGVRTRDGRSAFAVPSGNERIMLVMGIAGLSWVVVALLLKDSITFLGLILGIVGLVLYFSYRSMRLEGRRLYDSDSDYARAGG